MLKLPAGVPSPEKVEESLLLILGLLRLPLYQHTSSVRLGYYHIGSGLTQSGRADRRLLYRPAPRQVGLLFRKEDIDSLALGSAVLGSGGGGNPYIGALLLRRAMESASVTQVEITPFDEVDESDFLICSAGMGSPAIGIEKIPNGSEYVRSFRGLESYVERRATHVSPIEIGGINSLVPLVVSVHSGLPVADGDGEGRAFPELQMTTFCGLGYSAAPVCMIEERGNTLIVNGISDWWTEKIARTVTVSFGGRAEVALYPLGGSDYRKGAIPGTLSMALEIGRSLTDGIRNKSAEDALSRSCHASLLFAGKLVDVKRYNTRGFAIGHAFLEGFDSYSHQRLKISFQNEYLLATLGAGEESKVIESTPNIISIHDESTLLPITTDQLRYGMRCKVFSIPIHKKWLFEGAEKLVGLGAFKLE